MRSRVGIFIEYPTEERAREALRLMPRRPGRHALRGDPPRLLRLRSTAETLAVDLLAVLLGACEGARRVGEGQGRRVA